MGYFPVLFIKELAFPVLPILLKTHLQILTWFKVLILNLAFLHLSNNNGGRG